MTGQSSTSGIVARDVCKSFGSHLVLDRVNLTVDEGSILALLASRSAIAGAVNTLESLGLIKRSRAAGERMDRVRIDMTSSQATGFDLSEYREQGELAREGLDLLADAPPQRRAILLEWAAFADFLVERLPMLEQEWTERREKLQAAGDLPEAPSLHREGGTR